MSYIISTDSTADLPASYVKEHDIAVQFLSYAFGDTIYELVSAPTVGGCMRM